MARKYLFRRRMTPEIVTLVHLGARDKLKQDIFTRVKLRGRPRKCEVTGVELKTGDIAWSPITNGNNRMDRITDAGIELLERSGKRG